MKNKRMNRVTFRCNNNDYYFLKSLKEQKNIGMSEYILNCLKLTDIYKNYRRILEC